MPLRGFFQWTHAGVKPLGAYEGNHPGNINLDHYILRTRGRMTRELVIHISEQIDLVRTPLQLWNGRS